jgi:hypothetical protein
MASDEMQVFLEGLKEKPSKNKLGSIEEQRADTDMFMANQAVPRNVLIDDFTLAGRPARKYFTEGVREDATLLLIRYLFGFSGDSLVSGAIGSGAERDTAEEVEAYIQERVPVR